MTESAQHRDRSPWLVVFGVVEILMGCLCALFVPLLILGRSLAAAAGQPAQPWGQLVGAMVLYALTAAALVWIGIGSIRRRRFARALSLVFGWSALVLGALVLAVVAATLPSAGRDPAVLAVAIVVLAIMAVPFVVIPAALVLFYRSPHVRATCEAADPVPGWTDACPLAVLGAAMWMVLGAVILVATALGGQAVLPVFGWAIVGLPAASATAALAGLWLYLAWLLYRLEPRGWWGTAGLVTLGCASGVVTFARMDLMDLYRRMNYPEQQIDAIRRMAWVTGPKFAVFTGILMLACLCYLLWIRRHFVGRGGTAASAVL